MDSTELININSKVLKFETFINDVLKEDLKEVHEKIDRKNTELAEWIQLKNIIQSIQDVDLVKGFKTKIDIGTNFYAQAKIEDASKIIINIGCGIFVEYSLEEALIVIEKRIKLAIKQIDIHRQESSSIKARIKLVLHGIQELESLR